jgi:hypothetical protein
LKFEGGSWGVEDGAAVCVFGFGELVQPHLHAMTRFACDMVSSETLEIEGGTRKALFEKSILNISVC